MYLKPTTNPRVFKLVVRQCNSVVFALQRLRAYPSVPVVSTAQFTWSRQRQLSRKAVTVRYYVLQQRNVPLYMDAKMLHFEVEH